MQIYIRRNKKSTASLTTKRCAQRYQEMSVREAYKPSSVIGGHLSRPIVTGGFKRNPESSTGRLKRSFVSCCGWGLHRGRVARPRVSSYLTFPPLHALRHAVSLCCTFPGVAPAGCYPALCPVQLGLSSHLFGARPPGSLTNSEHSSTHSGFCQPEASIQFQRIDSIIASIFSSVSN